MNWTVTRTKICYISINNVCVYIYMYVSINICVYIKNKNSDTIIQWYNSDTHHTCALKKKYLS